MTEAMKIESNEMLTPSEARQYISNFRDKNYLKKLCKGLCGKKEIVDTIEYIKSIKKAAIKSFENSNNKKDISVFFELNGIAAEMIQIIESEIERFGISLSNERVR